MKQYTSRSASYPLWVMHLLMLIAATLVSTSFTVGKAIADGMDPAILTLIRFGLAAILSLPYIKKRYGLERPSTNDLFRYSIISGALIAFFWLMFLSLRWTTALNQRTWQTWVPEPCMPSQRCTG